MITFNLPKEMIYVSLYIHFKYTSVYNMAVRNLKNT